MKKQRLVIGPEPKRRLPRRQLLRGALLLALVGVVVARFFFFEMVVVRGNTMAPNILDGDVLLLLRQATPALGDVVLLERDDATVLRRVVGMPGDRLGSNDGVLTRNEMPLETRVLGNFAYREVADDANRPRRQRHLHERFDDGRGHAILAEHVGAARPWSLELPGVEVPPGHVFVLCDNRRTCPLDERAGVVPLSWVRGVAPYLMWYGEARVDPPERPFYGAFHSTGSTSTAGPGAGKGRVPRK